MPMILLFIMVFLTQASYAAKVKFHKPETEAEKALDMILRVESGLVYASLEKYATKNFITAMNKVEDELRKNEDIWPQDPVSCLQDDTDIGYNYYTHKQSKNEAYIQIILMEFLESKHDKHISFKMKFDSDGTWKIDANNCIPHKQFPEI